MLITPAHIVSLAQSSDGVNNLALTMRTQMTQNEIDNRGKSLSLKHKKDLVELYSQVMDIPVTMAQVNVIVELHPKARVYIAGGDLGDTDVRDVAMDALCQFVLGCDHPTYNDGLGGSRLEVFRDTLRHMFQQLKF